MTARDKILEFARMHGPVLPIEVAKILQTDTIIAGAHLSELVASKRLFVSHVKVGGSPVYYLPGHEYRLQQYTKNLHQKEQQTYTLLKEKQVLRDRALDPLTRVTLRSIKDFAKPLEVDVDNTKELFWKWYLLSTPEASTIINQLLNKPPLPTTSPLIDTEKVITEKPKIEKPTIETPTTETTTPPTKPHPLPQTRLHPSPQPPSQAQLHPLPPQQTPLQPPTSPPISPPTQPQTLLRTRTPSLASPQSPGKPDIKTQTKTETIIEPKTETKEKAPPIPQKEQPETKITLAEQAKSTDPFFKHLERFLTKKNITVCETQIKRKNNEVDCVVNVPTSLGNVQFYGKARNKKKIDENDLHSVYAQGQLRKLPILLFSPGPPTKKAQALLEKEFCGITFISLPPPKETQREAQREGQKEM